MTINPHIIQALARERVANLRRDAAACRMAAERRQARAMARPDARPQPAQKAGQDLIPVGTEER